MRSQSALTDPFGQNGKLAGHSVLPCAVEALPLDRLIAALSQAAQRSRPEQPRDRYPNAPD